MNKTVRGAMAIAVLAATGVMVQGETVAQDKPSARTEAKGVMATGQHRGHTNDKLHFLPDDGRELTLKVEIPGDKSRKWHKDHEALSRVTVTYHKAPDGGLVATSIRKAP